MLSLFQPQKILFRDRKAPFPTVLRLAQRDFFHNMVCSHLKLQIVGFFTNHSGSTQPVAAESPSYLGQGGIPAIMEVFRKVGDSMQSCLLIEGKQQVLNRKQFQIGPI